MAADACPFMRPHPGRSRRKWLICRRGRAAWAMRSPTHLTSTESHDVFPSAQRSTTGPGAHGVRPARPRPPADLDDGRRPDRAAASRPCRCERDRARRRCAAAAAAAGGRRACAPRCRDAGPDAGAPGTSRCRADRRRLDPASAACARRRRATPASRPQRRGPAAAARAERRDAPSTGTERSHARRRSARRTALAASARTARRRRDAACSADARAGDSCAAVGHRLVDALSGHGRRPPNHWRAAAVCATRPRLQGGFAGRVHRGEGRERAAGRIDGRKPLFLSAFRRRSTFNFNRTTTCIGSIPPSSRP